MNKLLLALAATALVGCAAPQQERATGIAATPIHDLNIANTPIPPLLLQAKAAPYALPTDRQCPALQAAVVQLDEVLGPDLDAPDPTTDEGTGAKASAAVGNAAMGAVQRTVEGAIPFRGWVRKLSGAERHSREVAAAITAGTVRRSFLKGLAAGHACAPMPMKVASSAN
ncbi:MAG: hypothetical protein ACJ8GW_04410 [Massilia sp.]